MSHSGFAFGESGDALLGYVHFPVGAEQRFTLFVDAQVNEAIAAVRLQLFEGAGFDLVNEHPVVVVSAHAVIELPDREILGAVEIEIIELHMEFVFGFKIDCSRLAVRFAFNRDVQFGAFKNQRRVDAFGWAERGGFG